MDLFAENPRAEYEAQERFQPDNWFGKILKWKLKFFFFFFLTCFEAWNVLIHMYIVHVIPFEAFPQTPILYPF